MDRHQGDDAQAGVLWARPCMLGGSAAVCGSTTGGRQACGAYTRSLTATPSWLSRFACACRDVGRGLALALLVLASFSAANGDLTAAEHLAERMGELEQLEAGFSQRLVDGRGMELRRTRGRLWAERPDRFRWEVEAPFAEVLIGDGETLWLWDPDLEQVTVRPYDERLQATPARLLSGAVDDLLEAFDVDRLAGSDGGERFTLWPRAGDALFERLEFMFESGEPRFLVIHDSLGQRTDVELIDVRTGFAEDAERFRFESPEGADVIHETAESVGHD